MNKNIANRLMRVATLLQVAAKAKYEVTVTYNPDQKSSKLKYVDLDRLVAKTLKKRLSDAGMGPNGRDLFFPCASEEEAANLIKLVNKKLKPVLKGVKATYSKIG